MLYTLNPFSEQQKLEHNLSGLNEDRLIEILKKHKLFTKFQQKIESQPQFKQKLFRKFENLGVLTSELAAFQTRNLSEFVRISKKLSKKDVHLLLIKSAGDFPHESSNFDCLVKPEQLFATSKMLEDEGYRECLNVREPHKFLFRKQQAPRELPLHIHTRVEWEALEFAHPQNLRDRARFFISDETGALVPSVEDAILITIAHYFFEDHEIKLYDMLKLYTLANKDRNVNWGYISSQAENLGWLDAFNLNINLINSMSIRCFGKKVFVGEAVNSFATFYSWTYRMVKSKPNGLQKIPYGVSALFFLRKILRNQHLSIKEKYSQINYVFSDILRRKSIGYIAV